MNPTDGVYIPILTSEAGTSMTVANWQASAIDTAAYSLSSLLMKPGFDFLMTLSDLASYVGWPGRLLLDATFPKQDANGLYTVQSIYDGHRIRMTMDDVMKLVLQLKPDFVVLPEINPALHASVWPSLPEGIFPFFPFTALPQDDANDRSYGVYIPYHGDGSPLIPADKHRLCYASGPIDLPTMLLLKKQGIHFIQSDIPAKDGVQGQVYTREGILSIQDPSLAMQFKAIDEECNCPVCREQWTRAYLYHLYEHTPQLCQRFLVQHNVYYCLNALSKLHL